MRNNLSQMISLSKVEEKLYRPADAFEHSRVTRLEHVNTTIVETPREGIINVAKHIADVIRKREEVGQHVVLSLASGRTMRDLFMELVRMHKEEGLSFKNVIVFTSSWSGNLGLLIFQDSPIKHIIKLKTFTDEKITKEPLQISIVRFIIKP